MNAYGFIWHYVCRHRAAFLALAACVLVAASSAVAVQYVMKLLVDAMAGPRESSAVWTYLAAFVAIIALESAIWRLTGWLGCRATVRIGVEIRLDLFDAINRQSMRYFAERMAGALGHRITATAGHFGALANTVVWRVAPPGVEFLAALVVFSTIDLAMMVSLAVITAGVTAGLIWFGERGRPLHTTYSSRANLVGGEVVDVITNMWAVKAFSARGREAARLRGQFEDEAGQQIRSWMYVEKARVIHDAALVLMASIMLVWALVLWSAGRITPGDVVVVSSLTFRILHSSRDLALSLVEMTQHVGFIEETLRTVHEPPSVADRADARPLAVKRGRVEFRGVSFSYDHGRDAVHDLDLTIEPGEKLGVVGPSGAGKSTLISLVQRLYDVDEGEILVDGQNIAAVQQDSLRAAIAIVPQEVLLFHRSIIDNIRFARPEASLEEIHRAADIAQVTPFVERLPEGFDTIVGERGMRVSGGQRQRIGIARAVLKNAPIVLLDEATSALDSETELLIQEGLARSLEGRTIIAAAHRLSTVAQFDRVIVMEGGRILEAGRPRDLMDKGGTFARLLALQSGGMAMAQGGS